MILPVLVGAAALAGASAALTQGTIEASEYQLKPLSPQNLFNMALAATTVAATVYLVRTKKLPF